MRNSKWILALVGLLACGLIAAGCGDDDDDELIDELRPRRARTQSDSTDTSSD